jgi:pyruvate dehydrogenase (quinone)
LEFTTSETVADYILKRLKEWSVERIYGFPGDGINGLMAALERSGDKPTFI